MKAEVYPVFRAHGYRCVYRILGDVGLCQAAMITLADAIDISEGSGVVQVLIDIPVTRRPPYQMVAGEAELSMFIHDDEGVDTLPLGELIAKTDTIVVHTEHHV